MRDQTELPTLPVHSVPPVHGAPEISITGLVARPTTATPADLAALPRVDIADDFACEEGWSVPGLRWQGVRLSDVLALAGPDAAARFVRIGSGDFVSPLALEDAGRAILCDRLNDAPLTIEHGAPWRLLVPGGVCYTSVKWVDRLEISAEAGDDSAQRIARGRLGP